MTETGGNGERHMGARWTSQVVTNTATIQLKAWATLVFNTFDVQYLFNTFDIKYIFNTFDIPKNVVDGCT